MNIAPVGVAIAVTVGVNVPIAVRVRRVDIAVVGNEVTVAVGFTAVGPCIPVTIGIEGDIDRIREVVLIEARPSRIASDDIHFQRGGRQAAAYLPRGIIGSCERSYSSCNS